MCLGPFGVYFLRISVGLDLLVNHTLSQKVVREILMRNLHSSGSLKNSLFYSKGELAELEAAERIRVIQSRIYEIQKLYGKLKTELASMERRKRRKLRKQSENGELLLMMTKVFSLDYFLTDFYQ